MQDGHRITRPTIKGWGRAEIFLAGWCTLALLTLIPATVLLRGSTPIFTVVWLSVALFVLARTRDASHLGFRRISGKNYLFATAVNLALVALAMAIAEPRTHTYRYLLTEALSNPRPDTTFAWLARFPGVAGLLGMFLYASFVTIFAEELFFRGLLLHSLQNSLGRWPAILMQAALFTIPNGIVVLFLPVIQGATYGLVYTFLAIGVAGGWSAARTQSIWPSLTTAALSNLILTIIVI
jgi:membrane protease YdiL (CAAX protease family)